MPRPLRHDFDGAWHHVFNRGARRDPIFELPEHCDLMLDILARTVDRHGIELHAYALMPNHFHLLVRVPQGNLSRAMQYFGCAYTRELNRVHKPRKWDGPLFRGRFRNQLLWTDASILTVSTYIHLNAIRAGIVKRLDQHCWSSLRAYLGVEVVPEWLSAKTITELAGGTRQLEEHVRSHRLQHELWPMDLDLDTGFYTEVEPRRIPAAIARPHLDPDDVLEEVSALTDCTRDALRVAQHGRGANPARRFAMWALADSTLLTLTGIARLLDTTAANVRMTIRRVTARPPTRVAAWMEEWSRRHPR